MNSQNLPTLQQNFCITNTFFLIKKNPKVDTIHGDMKHEHLNEAELFSKSESLQGATYNKLPIVFL